MSRVLVMARPDARRSQLCGILAHAGYEAVAVDDAAAFRASRDWSLYDILVVEPQTPDVAADETLRTYVSRFRPSIVTLTPRWNPEVVRLAIENRQAERLSQRGTRRKEAEFYGTPREIASLELVLLEAALSPVPRPALMTAAQGSGFENWSGRMVKHMLRRLERKGELVPDEQTGSFQTTPAGQRRLEHARAAASVRSA
jgi:hypothetical protein